MNDQPVNPPDANRNGLLGAATAVLALAVLLQMGANTFHALQQRQALELAIANQEAPLARALTVRRQLNSLAGKTVQLAQEGNATAAAIIEKMTAAGVKFSPTNNRGQDE